MTAKSLRMIALIIIASMLLALAACQAAVPTTTLTSAPTGSQATTTTQPAPTPTPEPPVTLTYWASYQSSGTGTDVSGVRTDPIAQEITKRTGVILDIIYLMSADEYNAKLASGDLPDMLLATLATDSKNLIDGGNIIDMAPLLADHGKDIEKGKVEFSKQFLSGGQNKVYFICTEASGLDAKPVKTFNAGTGIGGFLRWDVYKKIGYPVWNGGLNDLIPILKQMQDAEPTTADGKKVYALSPWLADWGLWNFTVYPEGIYNIFAEAGGFVDINPDTNEITDQIGNPNSTLWQGAQFYNKAFQAGILDPDCAMEKFDQAMEKQNSGRVLISPCNWSVSGANAEFAKNGELDKGFMAIKTPSTITQVCNFFKNPFSGRFAWAITSKCKTPEKAMDLINFLNSGDGTRLLLNGIEGVNWNVGNDGVPHLTSDTLQLLKKGSVDDQLKAGLGGTNGLLLMYQGSWDRKYNCPAAFVNNEDVSAQMVNATPFEKDYCDHYTVAYPDQLWEKILPEQSKVHDGSYMSMIGLPTAEIKQIDDNLLNYLLVQMVKIVNSKTDEDFDAAQTKIIADCKAMGSETAFNWYKSQYDTAISNMQAFYDSIK